MSPNVLRPQFRELLTMHELADYLNKPGTEAARKWARRQQARGKLLLLKVGRDWRVDRRDVDLVIDRDTKVAIGE